MSTFEQMKMKVEQPSLCTLSLGVRKKRIKPRFINVPISEKTVLMFYYSLTALRHGSYVAFGKLIINMSTRTNP